MDEGKRQALGQEPPMFREQRDRKTCYGTPKEVNINNNEFIYNPCCVLVSIQNNLYTCLVSKSS